MDCIMRWIIYLSILTTSFDIFLSWQVAGTIRFTQVVLLIPMLYLLVCLLLGRKLYFPPNIKWLFIWSCFLLAFLLNTVHLERTIGYWIWLMMNLFTIILVVNMFRRDIQIHRLLYFYGWSFVLVAFFGLFQFFTAPFLHLATPLVTQWWIPYTLARVNGFSYEPSYFATYEIIGWTMFLSLIYFKDTTLYPAKQRNFLFTVLTISIILSSSRMGILMMLVLIGLIFLQKIFVNFYQVVNKRKISIVFFRNAIISSLILIGVLLFFVSTVDFSQYEFLLNGTGIGGTAAHSVDERSLAMSRTFEIFLENPIIGVSLGGIPENISDMIGMSGNFKSEGSAVFLEVLAASGIIGIIPFFIYFFKMFYDSWRVARRFKNKIILALLVSLASELIILQLNQNILRPYLWMHIAILSAVLSAVKSTPTIK